MFQVHEKKKGDTEQRKNGPRVAGEGKIRLTSLDMPKKDLMRILLFIFLALGGQIMGRYGVNLLKFYQIYPCPFLSNTFLIPSSEDF
jgi:hypothetical protein